MTSEEARARVAKGAAWLDENKPGWAQILEHQRIQMANCHRCVLGRLYGQYSTGRKQLGLARDSQDYGFYVDTWDEGEAKAHYAMLHDCWIKAIAERVSAAPVVEWQHREDVTA